MTHPAFSEQERIALEFAFRSSTVPNSVDDEVAERLRANWDAGEIVEIMGVIALFGFLNRWNDSIGTEIEPGAAESGNRYLKVRGWTTGKHTY
jgi:alkylhydroperoxidase family enzyme